MVPQTQRWWRGPVFDGLGGETDEGGDCFAACLASILEVPIGGFPNFLADGTLGAGGWWHRWNLWLYEHYRHELIFWNRHELPEPNALAWWVAGVEKARHAVVFYKDEFRWDPAPEGCKRAWTIDDVERGVALFSIGSIFDREAGPYEAKLNANGVPIVAMHGADNRSDRRVLRRIVPTVNPRFAGGMEAAGIEPASAAAPAERLQA